MPPKNEPLVVSEGPWRSFAIMLFVQTALLRTTVKGSGRHRRFPVHLSSRPRRPLPSSRSFLSFSVGFRCEADAIVPNAHWAALRFFARSGEGRLQGTLLVIRQGEVGAGSPRLLGVGEALAESHLPRETSHLRGENTVAQLSTPRAAREGDWGGGQPGEAAGESGADAGQEARGRLTQS